MYDFVILAHNGMGDDAEWMIAGSPEMADHMADVTFRDKKYVAIYKLGEEVRKVRRQ